jgi:hypothetical protein
MQESDWDSFLERLVVQTKSAIDQFAAEHGDQEVCYFAYDSEPRYGYVLTCFNTSSAARANVREQREYHTRYRRELMADPVWVNDACYQVRANSISPICNNTGDFAYQGFTEIAFPEWKEFAESAAYPEAGDNDEDYLQSRVSRLFSRATDQLVDSGAFWALRLATPMLMGSGFHDGGQHILDMLNLPE